MDRTALERDFALRIVQKLRDAGHEAYWAGGCVRDQLLGLTPKDYDIATSAHPKQVRKLFPRTVAVGMSFGVVEVIEHPPEGHALVVQVATFRSDCGYSDGRRPDAVVFCSAREDALRRDFTINGMFFDPLTGQVLDYVGGQEDLKACVLRAIGDPFRRFEEDKLRMLRAVRMASRFELSIDPPTQSAIQHMADQIHVVSAERIADELRKLLTDRHRARGMRLFHDLGLAAWVMPELGPMSGLPQGHPRPETPGLPPPGQPGESRPGDALGDLWEHVLRVLELLGPKASVTLAFAALLHDVGKPRTVGRTPDRYTFHGHEHVGRRLAEEICLRLKMSNEEQERIAWLVEKHQVLCDVKQMRTSKLKMLLAHPGIRELLDLHRADALSCHRSIEHVEYCERLLEEWTQEDLDPSAVLNGHDLIRAGMQPGPDFKRILEAVREAQLEGTVRNTAEAWELVTKLRSQEG
jgi:poly(A) polymerase